MRPDIVPAGHPVPAAPCPASLACPGAVPADRVPAPPGPALSGPALPVSAQTAQAMVQLGWPGQTMWPAEVHRRWLDRAGAATADPGIPARDRLALTVDRVTALMHLGDEAGWVAAAGFPHDVTAPKEAGEVLRGCLNIGDSAMRWGRYDEARWRLSAALRLADQHHYPHMRELVMATLIHLDWFSGAWTGLARRADAMARSGEPSVQLDAVLVAGQLDLADGMYHCAEEKLERVLEEEQRRGLAYLSAEAAAALARLRLADGRAGDARAITEEPMRVIAAKGIWLWAAELAPVRMEALTAEGRTAEAVRLVARFARGLRGRSAPAPHAGLATCQAILAECRGRMDRAARLFADAAQAWDALPRPYAALLARERQGHCLIGAGQRRAGLTVLRDVFRALTALPARGDAVRVMHALRDHGIEVRIPARSGTGPFATAPASTARIARPGWPGHEGQVSHAGVVRLHAVRPALRGVRITSSEGSVRGTGSQPARSSAGETPGTAGEPAAGLADVIEMSQAHPAAEGAPVAPAGVTELPARAAVGRGSGQGSTVGRGSGQGSTAGRSTARNEEIAGQIQRAYPGYHVWVSDAGWWYATRIRPWARGQSATVHGPGPGELTGALAAEEAATLGRAMAGAR